MNNLEIRNYYFVTDSILSKKGIYNDAEAAINAGCRIVQYREKNKSTKEMIKEAKKIKNICNGRAIFLIDDRVDVALAVNADGIHIGQDDIPYNVARVLLGNDKIIGLTVHNLKESIEAKKLGVDYIGLAPIFKTDTKEDTRNPIGVNIIKTVKKNVNIPLVAVGGINKKNLCDVIHSGAEAVVSIHAILNSNDVYNEIVGFNKIIKECKAK